MKTLRNWSSDWTIGNVRPRFQADNISQSLDRKIREIADNDIIEEIVEPIASLKIEEGREFVAAIKRFLGI